MDMDREYANGAFIPGSDALPDLWAQKAAAFRANLGKSARLGLPYGPEPRQALDLFLPQTTPRGLLVFVHGGYWLAMGRESWSHLAAGALARGWACAMPSYTLAPQARIRDITDEIANAVAVAAAEVAGPLVITGHSAGGHLAARMGCADHHHPRTARVVPISPLADLEPLLQTEMNQTSGSTPKKPLPKARRITPAPATPISGSAAMNAQPFCGRPAPCQNPGIALGPSIQACTTSTSSTACNTQTQRCSPPA